MKPKKLFLIAFSLISVFFSFVLLRANAEPPEKQNLIIFYSPTCHSCMKIKEEIMPKLEKEFEAKIRFEYKDISDIENYRLMLGLQEKYKPEIKESLPVFYSAGKFFYPQDSDFRQIKDFILALPQAPAGREQGVAHQELIERFKSFTPLVIISAGLIDGINPCAFTVVVFFISFLALQGYRKKELVLIGMCFICAVFITYILIGLGLFAFLYKLSGFWAAAKITNLIIGIFSILLGALSVYDYFYFKKTKDSEGLVLRLPDAVKAQIHRIVGMHYRKSSEGQNSGNGVLGKIVLSAFVTGFLISILEAVCTGQTYLPTISFILKTATLKLRAFFYLLLYNFMFILPLLVIFLLALTGVTSEQFSKFLRRHLGVTKILMAILFFSLGMFLIWRL